MKVKMSNDPRKASKTMWPIQLQSVKKDNSCMEPGFKKHACHLKSSMITNASMFGMCLDSQNPFHAFIAFSCKSLGYS